MRTNKIRLSEHFSLHEFECPCCRAVKLYPALLAALQLLRDGLQQPLVATSGYRCKARNAEVGGASRSRHMLGRAADVKVPDALQETLCRLAVRCGFTRAIAYGERNFVHLEV